MTIVKIHIPFEPVPWAAPKIGRGHTYDPREADKRAVRYLIAEQYSGPLLDCPMLISFSFVCSIPKTASKKKREAMLSGELVPVKGDLTNFQKLYEDCLKGIVIKDDRKVSIIFAKKMYGEKPSVSIGVYADPN